MGIPMANTNVPLAGRSVLGTQAGAPVLAAQAVPQATTGNGQVFDLTLLAEVDNVAEASSPETAEAEAQSLEQGIQLFEDGDAADEGQRPRREQPDAELAEAAAVITGAGAAMQASPLPLAVTARTLAADNLRPEGVTGHAARLMPAMAAANHGSDAISAGTAQDGAVQSSASSAQVLPGSLTLVSGMTLDVRQLMASASAQPAATSASGGQGARNALVEMLGERLQVQISQRSEHAVIRLDPPHMGRIEIFITQEAGNTQVQIRASHSEVARQLHAIGEQLRQDLVQRQNGEVSVHVQDGGREAEGRNRQRQQHAATREEPGHALREEETESGEALRFALQS